MLPVLIASLAALGCLIGALVCLRRKRFIDDLPTSKTQGVFIGMTELKGSAESESPLTSYLAGIRCVWYSWKVEEHWSRTETYYDGKGFHTRTDSGWKEVAAGGENPPFYLKDDTGIIRVVPDGANIHGVASFERTCGAKDPLYFAKGPLFAVDNSTHRRRFKETVLPVHTPLYIMGQARERRDVVAAEIARDKNAPIFVISVKTEKQLSSAYVWWIWMWIILGLLCAGGGAFFAAKTAAGQSWQPLLVALGIYFIAFAAGWIWMVHNSLVALKNRVNQAWSQVDVQLKRRADLIPNLISCVEGYSAQEKALQRLVAELRSQADKTTWGGVLRGYSHRLLALAESYPAVKADRAFLELQKSLADTEGRIALARGYFNDIVTFYNTRLEIIPDRFVGRMARLFRQNLMQAEDIERAPVVVHLAE